MTSRILCTLDPHKLGPGLVLDQGNLVVNAGSSNVSYPLDIHRAVFGTLPIGSGTLGFECQFYSTSQGNLSGLLSVGVAEVNCALDKYVGEEALSWGYWPADGIVYNNNTDISTGVASPALQIVGERQRIGVLLVQDPTTPIVAFQVNGNYIFQAALTAGKFYVPAISLGSATVGDVSAYCNFGQHALDYPIMTVNK